MVSRLKLLKAAYCILGIFFTFFIVLDWIVKSRPNLLPWAKTHMFVILLGGCISSAALSIYHASLYWGKYGSKIFKGAERERGSFVYYFSRFIMPLVFFGISFRFLGDIGELTKQAWLVNIGDVGSNILGAIILIGFILYPIYEKRDKMPHR